MPNRVSALLYDFLSSALRPGPLKILKEGMSHMKIPWTFFCLLQRISQFLARADLIRALSPGNFLIERRDAKRIVEGLPFPS